MLPEEKAAIEGNYPTTTNSPSARGARKNGRVNFPNPEFGIEYGTIFTFSTNYLPLKVFFSSHTMYLIFMYILF